MQDKANRKYLSAKQSQRYALAMAKAFTFARITAYCVLKHSNAVMVLFVVFDDLLRSLFYITPKLVTNI